MEENRLRYSNEWIVDKTITELQTAMDNGEITSLEIVKLYLKRIAAYNLHGPRLNAVIEVNPDALHIAEAMDVERDRQGSRGPLHGIPVLIKDNIDTGDKMHTSAGTLALAENYASEDALVTRKLREAGAIILGKTNLTELANFMTENMPNGYSSRGGQVLNPYGPGRLDTGGSSAGTGSAIAANFATVGIGTETSGSILSPSSQQSLVGIKPTVGLISRTGIIPIAHSQDTAGPMARTVEDAAILLGVLTGLDDKDAATNTSASYIQTEYTKYLDPNGLKSARIGVARQFYTELKNEELEVMERAIQALRDQGADVIDPIEIPTFDAEWDYNVLIYEFKSDLNAYLQKCKGNVPVKTLKQLIEFNKQNEEVTLKFGQTLLELAEKTSGNLIEAEYLNSRLKDLELSRDEGIDAVMRKHQLDAFITPANLGAGIPAKAGYPSITVPGGYAKDGEPLGVTFTGLAYSEPNLIKLAYAFEQATHFRVSPNLNRD
jgi:amidase